MRKSAKMPPVCIADEVPFDIPDSWEWIRLSTICQLTNGETISDVSYPVMDANFLRNRGNIVFKNNGKLAYKGEKVILVDGENSGEVFTVPQNGYIGSTFKLLWISTKVYETYILSFIELYRLPLKNSKRGAAIPHLNKTMFF